MVELTKSELESAMSADWLLEQGLDQHPYNRMRSMKVRSQQLNDKIAKGSALSYKGELARYSSSVLAKARSWYK